MNNMNEFNKMVDKMLDEEQAKHEKAINDKNYYAELKEEAIKKERTSRATIKELELAKSHAQKAQQASGTDNEEEVISVEETKETSKKSNNGAKGLVNLVVAVALLAGGAAGYKLYKESKVGDVKLVTQDGMINLVKTNPENNEVINETNNDVSYDYENNEVVVNDTIVTEENANNYEFNYDGNVALVNDTEYVELTTEKFETLAAETINTLKGYGLQVSEEDVIKYVMIRNIDKLSQDNKELISTIVGEQDIDEAFADADSVIDAIMTYNLLYFDANHNTDGFISASVGVFDETQKARVLEIEKRVYELGANYQDEERYNELTKALLSDMINPTKEISELEDGVSYGVEWIDMYMVRSTFGTDRYIELSEENASKVKYFVSFAGDGEEYENNALVNGNYRNILALLADCEKVKTRTK